VFDGIRAGVAGDRSQFYKDITLPSRVQPAWRQDFGRHPRALVVQGMMGGVKGHYDCIKAFSETDFTEDLKKFDVPTLILHGDDDQIVPIGAAGLNVREAGEEIRAEGISGFSARECAQPTQTRSTPTCLNSSRPD